MDYYRFPNEYRNALLEKSASIEKPISYKKEEEIKDLRSRINILERPPDVHYYWNPVKVGCFLSPLGGCAGIVALAFLSTAIGIIRLNDDFLAWPSVIVGTIAGWVIFWFLSVKIFEIKHNRKFNISKNKSKNKAEIEFLKNRIAEIEKDYNEAHSARTKTVNQECDEYDAGFEREAVNLGVQFAGSEMISEIASEISDNFIKTINSADRSPHIEYINVPYEFKVFRDKITSIHGTVDFHLKRYRVLQYAVEQAALAKTIGHDIEVKLKMEVSKDASGTKPDIQIEYKYPYYNRFNEGVTVIITYSALNGNYKSVQGWN